jgi:hypothetical protein
MVNNQFAGVCEFFKLTGEANSPFTVNGQSAALVNGQWSIFL